MIDSGLTGGTDIYGPPSGRMDDSTIISMPRFAAIIRGPVVSGNYGNSLPLPTNFESHGVYFNGPYSNNGITTALNDAINSNAFVPITGHNVIDSVIDKDQDRSISSVSKMIMSVIHNYDAGLSGGFVQYTKDLAGSCVHDAMGAGSQQSAYRSPAYRSAYVNNAYRRGAYR
jgi:hypothetical protein